MGLIQVRQEFTNKKFTFTVPGNESTVKSLVNSDILEGNVSVLEENTSESNTGTKSKEAYSGQLYIKQKEVGAGYGFYVNCVFNTMQSNLIDSQVISTGKTIKLGSEEFDSCILTRLGSQNVASK